MVQEPHIYGGQVRLGALGVSSLSFLDRDRHSSSCTRISAWSLPRNLSPHRAQRAVWKRSLFACLVLYYHDYALRPPVVFFASWRRWFNKHCSTSTRILPI